MLLGVAIDPCTTRKWRGWIGNITWATPPKQCSTHKHLTSAETVYPKSAADCIQTPGATEMIPYWGVRRHYSLLGHSVPCHYNLLGHEVSLAITAYWDTGPDMSPARHVPGHYSFLGHEGYLTTLPL